MIYSRERRNSEKIINVFLSDIKALVKKKQRTNLNGKRREIMKNFSFTSAQILSNVCSTVGDLLQRAPSTIIPRHYCVYLLFICLPLPPTPLFTRGNFFNDFFPPIYSSVWSIKTNFMLFMYLLMLLAYLCF